ncbi:hypothetical protein [Reyranella soli]|uniref:Lipoprotein n=1 Tax=Reyranella soli TaxID=1230389 RepID=A0A512NKM6_9HYPH|nr:hypothetical protein [Reyranella soli]GEP59508.1 hypothetical protein RSO01_66740 [Reyranella soli]
MRVRNLCGVALTILAVSPALAQAPTPSSCNTLASTIAVGYTTNFTNRDYNALRYYATCEASSSHAGGGLSIAYQAFSLGGNYEESRNSQLCRQSREALGFSDTEYVNAKNVYSQAFPVIERCLELASKQWDIKYISAGNDAVSLTIAHGSVNGGELLGADIVPQGGLTCSPSLPAQKQTIKPESPFSTLCYRTPIVQIVDGVQVRSAEDAVIALRLENGPLLIPLKGYQTSIVARLQQRIDDQIATIKLKPSDFYIKSFGPVIQKAEGNCDADVLIAAACTNSNRAQAAVGPEFFEKDGKRWARCQRYGNIVWEAEGQLTCLKLR